MEKSKKIDFNPEEVQRLEDAHGLTVLKLVAATVDAVASHSTAALLIKPKTGIYFTDSNALKRVGRKY